MSGGPQVGFRRRLTTGVYVVGSDPDSDIPLNDPSLSSRHLRIEVTDGRVSVADAGSSSGCHIDGVSLVAGTSRVIGERQRIEIGQTAISFETPRAGDGFVNFYPAPRVAAENTRAMVSLDATPRRSSTGGRFSFWAALLPLIVAFALFVAVEELMVLFVAAITPVVGLGRLLSERTRRAAAIRERLSELRAEILRLRAAEAHARRAASPDVAALSSRAYEYAISLWERRPYHTDFLDLRVGSADQRSQRQIEVSPSGDRSVDAEIDAFVRTTATLCARWWFSPRIG